jgi:hypothetical protein
VTGVRRKRRIDENAELERSVGGVLIPSRCLIKGGEWRNCVGHGHGLKGKAISAAGGRVVKSECSASQQINMSVLSMYCKVQCASRAGGRACRQNVPTKLHLLEKVNY